MADVDGIAEFFNELGSVSTVQGKTSILSHASCDEWDALKWLLNPYIVTGISTKRLSKRKSTVKCPFESIAAVCDYLAVMNTGNDATVAMVQSFIDKYPAHREFLEKFFTKTLKCGVDHKLANKVAPNSVPHFDVMLGTPIDKCADTAKDGALMFVSQKLNGTRIVYAHGKLYTRSGREYTGLEHIVKAIGELVKELQSRSKKWPGEWTFDGELVYKDAALNDSECFQKGTGIANSKDKDKSMLRMVIFDCLPTNEFDYGKGKEPYSERLKRLSEIETLVADNPKYAGAIEVVKRFDVTTSLSIVKEYLAKAEGLGYEGVMINLDTPYECKRTKNLIKCKVFYDVELLCVDVERGTNKYADTLGCIVCKMNGNIVRVGSGFTDEQRDAFWSDPKSIVGKQVTVKYKEITHDKDGNESLQFPVFVGVRLDWDK